MPTSLTITGLFSLLLIAGCGSECLVGSPVSLKSFVLHDVQGLSGGCAIWASGDRFAVIQLVGKPPKGHSGLWEKRYTTKLTAEQWTEMERLVGEHCLAAIKIPERSGVPDEAHPIIMVITQDGTTIKARKWASDKNKDFDPVYGYLLGLCRVHGEPIREGEFDGSWHPDGFAVPWK